MPGDEPQNKHTDRTMRSFFFAFGVPEEYYREMDGALILIALLALAIYIGVIVAATIIASRKGRSAIGWCVLTIIFPIAILFVAIAAPANAYVQQPTVQQPTQVSETNAIDAQIIQSVRRSPIVFGLLVLIPFSLYLVTTYDPFFSAYAFGATHLPTFFYYSALAWLLVIAFRYKKIHLIAIPISFFIIGIFWIYIGILNFNWVLRDPIAYTFEFFLLSPLEDGFIFIMLLTYLFYFIAFASIYFLQKRLKAEFEAEAKGPSL